MDQPPPKPTEPPAPQLEDLTFRPSPEPTLGVELELQILDRESGDLAPGAVRLLQLCAEEGVEGATAELVQSMIEVKTGVCRSVAEVRETLVPRLRRVRTLANSLGFDLAMGGTHPSTARAQWPCSRTSATSASSTGWPG